MKTRLLIVDDNGPELRALCETLEDKGYETTCCETAGEALRRLQEARFDVMLTDLRMPDIDGIELVRRALEIDPDLVPVVITGQASIPSAVQAMQVGALDYVLKPFRIGAILPVLNRAVQVRQLRVENRDLQARLARRNAELEAANRELDAFASRVAHDLREPVGLVRGFARMLYERGEDRLGVEGAEYLRHIIDSAEHADRLIRDLLTFARLGDEPVQRRSLDLDRLVQRVRTMVELGAPGRRIEWRIQALPEVRGDESLLQQVFFNLLSNAVKYTRTRELSRIGISYRLDPKLGHLISVRDNGVGFDRGQADRLFTPFQRLHRAEQFEGSGMGLANVRRIVERHGGTVRAESIPGEGAVFSFTIPADPESPAKDGVQDESA